MCGIIGIAKNSDSIPLILSGLKALEYRGYDSSGIACDIDNQLIHEKSLGKITKLINKLKTKKLIGNTTIAHTRWATHGIPSLKNAHPFVKDKCALVHNGIIENYEDLIKDFSLNKNNLQSDTDTEVVAEIYNNLLLKHRDPIKSLITIMKKIKGTFAFALLIKGSNSIYAARRGSPLMIGLSKKYNMISSDVLGLPDDIKEVIFLEENDIVQISNKSFTIFDISGKKIKRKIHSHTNKKALLDKGKYKHFMLKEIYHQPSSIQDIIVNFTDKKNKKILLPNCKINFNNVTNLHFAACGTAYYACMIAKYWLDQFTHIPTSIDIGSEYRYRQHKLDKNSVGIVVSQSGETMDTLECLKRFKDNNLYTAAVVNVLNSSIARESNYIIPCLSGPEIGVASTKAFTSQLMVLALLTLYIQQQKNIDTPDNIKKINSLFTLSKKIQIVLNNSPIIKKVIGILKNSKSIFYIGRGTMYPLALEGALKLKEITYKHCEGYAAGELKHGPLALIEKNIPVIVLAPYDKNFYKLLSNVQEIKARKGKIIMITDNKGASKAHKYSDEIIILPETNIITAPIVYSLPVQMIAYYLGVKLGTDIDQPRNLAKSVTVE